MRSFVESTSASLDRMRWVSSSWPISSENTSTGRPVVWATWVAMPEPERRLAHRRAGADDVQRRGLQAGQQLVEVVVAGGDAGDRVAAGERLLEAVDRQLHQLADAAGSESVTRSSATLNTLRLGLVEGLGDVVGPA